MKTLKIRIRGERALFRNIAIPGADVAEDLCKRDNILLTRTVKGIIGSVLGLWRSFDVPPPAGVSYALLADSLEEWCKQANLNVMAVDYKFKEERTVGQHRHKNIEGFTKHNESGPKPLVYHWDVDLLVTLELADVSAQELVDAIRQPIGTSYLGQSNCPAQIHIEV